MVESIPHDSFELIIEILNIQFVADAVNRFDVISATFFHYFFSKIFDVAVNKIIGISQVCMISPKMLRYGFLGEHFAWIRNKINQELVFCAREADLLIVDMNHHFIGKDS